MSDTKVVVQRLLCRMKKKLSIAEVCNAAQKALTFAQRLLHRMLTGNYKVTLTDNEIVKELLKRLTQRLIELVQHELKELDR